jgi:hypothetical protein
MAFISSGDGAGQAEGRVPAASSATLCQQGVGALHRPQSAAGELVFFFYFRTAVSSKRRQSSCIRILGFSSIQFATKPIHGLKHEVSIQVGVRKEAGRIQSRS